MCSTFIANLIFLTLVLNVIVPIYCDDYQLILTHNGPIVRGGTVDFTATLYKGDSLASGSFEYIWNDIAIPEHQRDISSKSPIDKWSVTYNETYPPGLYVMQVLVKKCYIINIYCPDITSARVLFEITATLNGGLLLKQNSTIRDKYVSSADLVHHSIELKPSDANYIAPAPTKLTYWFVDCMYYGVSNNNSFIIQYPKPETEYTIEALMMVDFTPLPPPTTTVKPTTTTAKPNITTTVPTTIKPTTTSKTTSIPSTTKGTTVTPLSTTKSVKQIRSNIIKRNTNSIMDIPKHDNMQNIPKQNITQLINGTVVPYNGSFPYVCNGSRVAMDYKKIYGYFKKKIQVKMPVSKVNITGNNWLQHGEVLLLTVKCLGSQNLRYCVDFKPGRYNITGNETCPIYYDLESCNFGISRYLSESVHTVVVIIENEVSKSITPVTVTVYKVKKQAQLSVIVVPVAFTLIAVVLIIFGVAYYLQNRSRYIIEVADFNFGEQYSDMEYKTFKERLRDSVANALTRAPLSENSDPPVWPPGKKYGSMT